MKVNGVWGIQKWQQKTTCRSSPYSFCSYIHQINPAFIFPVVKLRMALYFFKVSSWLTFTYLADAFIQSDLQMRTIEAIKTNNRAIICKCYDKSWLAECSTCRKDKNIFICILFGSLKINLAAAFWINCRDLIELAGRPVKKALQ